MPRLSGIQTMNGGTVILDLSKDERLKISRAMARALAEMHTLTFECVKNQKDINVFAPPNGVQKHSAEYAERIIARRLDGIENLIGIKESDVKYIKEIAEKSRNAFNVPFEPCFLMGDFKEDNVLFSNDNGEWKVCAVFDFAMSHFGDNEKDISRLYAMYTDEDVDLTKEFIRTYLKLNNPRDGFFERLKFYSLDERIGIWYWAKNAGITWWDKDMTLAEWLELYLNVEF
jgi:aminoglycoside phosphotransferase (APT) family kinase protein